MTLEHLRIAVFRPEDQDAVRDLILAGLGEHWGHVDPALNPDLDDIAASYGAGVVLVAWLDGEIVGTGAVVPRPDDVSEIVRMSVAATQRRRGIGARLLTELVATAARSGSRRVVLETTATWHEVIAFYTASGFRLTHHADGSFGPDAYFSLDLPPGRAP